MTWLLAVYVIALAVLVVLAVREHLRRPCGHQLFHGTKYPFDATCSLPPKHEGEHRSECGWKWAEGDLCLHR